MNTSEYIIDLSNLFKKKAKFMDLPAYLDAIREMPIDGGNVVLTGPAPVWLYLKVAHSLHGRAGKLFYDSPASGRVLIFDHDPF